MGRRSLRGSGEMRLGKVSGAFSVKLLVIVLLEFLLELLFPNAYSNFEDVISFKKGRM